MRVLVANRGEIALRVLRGVKTLGHEAIAVYSDVDAALPFVCAADHAVCIGPAPAAESYLSIEKIIAACRTTGATAVHPGYGFLSENPRFADAVESAGIVFIGPTGASMRLMGDKTAAIETARAAQVPTVPSYTPATGEDPKRLAREAQNIGFPVLIKAAAGGGGKGMRVARNLAELAELLPSAVRESTSAFGDGRVFIERYIERARHVEVQVLGDGKGDGVALGERDCTLQRRHQKLIEEAPAPRLADAVRTRLHAAAVALVKMTSYRGAGTIEFILTPTGEFFFLEMNTRLQVEHPVTELVHGIDLVALQLAVALDEPLPASLRNCVPRGHAIEVRVYAETPATGFLPSIGRLTEVVWPAGPGIRVDAGYERGNEVSMHYDPLIAKIIAHGADRAQCIARLRSALAETFVAGVDTTVGYCRDLLGRAEFRDMDVYTTFIQEHANGATPTTGDDGWTRAAAAAAVSLGVQEGARAANGAGAQQIAPLWQSLPGWKMCNS